MRLFINAGADVNARTNAGATALMWCTNSFERVRLLIRHGANLNARSKQGHTPLLIAAHHAGNLKVVRLLLSRGASLRNAMDELGYTPLIRRFSETNDTETMKLLLAKGDKPDAANKAGFTPLMQTGSFGNEELVKLLIARGADVNAQSGPVSGPGVKNGPIALGNFTPLLLSVAAGHTGTVRLLLDAGAETNARDVRGMTPLMLAIATDHPNQDIVRMLLAHKADTSVKSKDGETVFDWAAKFGHPGILAMLGSQAAPKVPPGTGPLDTRNSPDKDAQTAIERSVRLMQTASVTSFREGGCVSCHAGNITTSAIAVARSKGLRFDAAQALDGSRATRCNSSVRRTVCWNALILQHRRFLHTRCSHSHWKGPRRTG